MRGIILAAGRGSRLDRRTDDRPKCLVELSGHPLLEWQLGAMHNAGIDDILVVRGYRGEMIKGAFEVRDNPDWPQTHMVASLMCAHEWLAEDECIISYSDIVYGADAITQLSNADGSLAILYDTRWRELWQERFDDPLSDAESFSVDENGNILDIGRKGVSFDDIHGQYMGLLKFTPESYRWIATLLDNQVELKNKLDMTSLLSRLIQDGHSIQGVPWDGVWCEVDDGSDLEVAEGKVRAGELVFPK
ncbi:choline kinase [Methanocalculus alkaliphilus]|uniref:phosphocholine cytidylyltransferase family protein n=1 Tax=Methanocalculus TaxID=71151 RepID=UPI0020A20E2D|nr:phosphocholine cytidylyltransferase family protein [Methanocalculus alkaliphilus]MCP1716199.1 choline kinase [Methanocalculus alkaliphilus]